jgi:uncharacterized phosphosugar-binding protein
LYIDQIWEIPMNDIIQEYIEICVTQLRTVASESQKSIDAAAHAIADCLASEGIFYLFGSGHSALIAREAFWRAGGLAPAIPIPDPLAGDGERIPGLGATIVGHYDLQPGDVLIVISNSGINPMPIEIAMVAKARGLTVISLTSIAHSSQVASRHPEGKKLMEVADIVIDTHGTPGDAAVELPGTDLKAGATSTVIGAAIIEAITTRAADILLERGLEPPVLISSNTPEGDRHNRTLSKHHRKRLIRYEVPTVDETATGPGSG